MAHRRFFSLVLFGLAALTYASADDVHDFNLLYTQLLAEYVTADPLSLHLLDYDAWAVDPAHGAARELALNIDPELLSDDARLAHYINIYNFLTIDLIVSEGERESIKNLGNVFRNVWKKYRWNVAGTERTLHAIEHAILRKQGDPRIHFALVCASYSCPNLRREAYQGEKLDAQLNEDVKLFLNNTYKGMQFHSSGVLISRIFYWYKRDFGGQQGVFRFVNSHSAKDIQAIRGYLPYDWQLNKIRGKELGSETKPGSKIF